MLDSCEVSSSISLLTPGKRDLRVPILAELNFKWTGAEVTSTTGPTAEAFSKYFVECMTDKNQGKLYPSDSPQGTPADQSHKYVRWCNFVAQQSPDQIWKNQGRTQTWP